MQEQWFWLRRVLIVIGLDLFFGFATVPALFDGNTTRGELIGAVTGILIGVLICIYAHPYLNPKPNDKPSLSFGSGAFLVVIGMGLLSIAALIVGKDIIDFLVWIAAVSFLTFLIYATIYLLFHRPNT